MSPPCTPGIVGLYVESARLPLPPAQTWLSPSLLLHTGSRTGTDGGRQLRAPSGPPEGGGVPGRVLCVRRVVDGEHQAGTLPTQHSAPLSDLQPLKRPHFLGWGQEDLCSGPLRASPGQTFDPQPLREEGTVGSSGGPPAPPTAQGPGGPLSPWAKSRT